MLRKIVMNFFLFGAVLCTAQSLNGADLHLILVGDVFASDIKNSVVTDLKTIENHANEVAKYTGLNLSVHQFSENHIRAEIVLKYLQELNTNFEDVVFFYFSGHGYRTPSKDGNPWPNIYFASNQTGIDLLEISNILNQKNTHLSIVLADCCNSALPNHLAPPVVKGHASINEEKLKKIYKKLFVETKGLILACGSKAGQPSWAVMNGGSLFTDSYNETFRYYIKWQSYDLLNWQVVFDHANYKTHQVAKKNGISQDPIYMTQESTL